MASPVFAQDELLFSSESSWATKTQPDDALRRRLVEFLVFNSAFGRHMYWLILIASPCWIYGEVTGSNNQCLCLPKAELNTKNSTDVWLSFWCSARFTKKSVWAKDKKRVDFIPTFCTTKFMDSPLRYGAIWLSFSFLTWPSADAVIVFSCCHTCIFLILLSHTSHFWCD